METTHDNSKWANRGVTPVVHFRVTISQETRDQLDELIKVHGGNYTFMMEALIAELPTLAGLLTNPVTPGRFNFIAEVTELSARRSRRDRTLPPRTINTVYRLSPSRKKILNDYCSALLVAKVTMVEGLVDYIYKIFVAGQQDVGQVETTALSLRIKEEIRFLAYNRKSNGRPRKSRPGSPKSTKE